MQGSVKIAPDIRRLSYLPPSKLTLTPTPEFEAPVPRNIAFPGLNFLISKSLFSFLLPSLKIVGIISYQPRYE